MKNPTNPLVAAFWSIAIPGFGQLYNRKYVKAIIFIIMEFAINANSNLNMAIYYTWLFDIPHTQEVVDYKWLLFYPCVYVFAIYDAYHDCCVLNGKAIPPMLPLPFFLTSFLGTIGIILSSGKISFLGLEKVGPIFFGAAILAIGLGFGSWLIFRLFPKRGSSETP
jgi:TM2 domain-containing membrane protein YozV